MINESHALQPRHHSGEVKLQCALIAFPELPRVVRCFASMSLKPLPELPGEGASSAPGPLEESLLR